MTTTPRQELFRFRDGSDPYLPQRLMAATEVERFYDEDHRLNAVLIPPGRDYVTAQGNEMLVAVIASNVALCARDPQSGVAGLCHVLPPAGLEEGDLLAPQVAVDMFLHKLREAGAALERLEIKLTGGADPSESTLRLGHHCASLVELAVNRHHLRIAAERLRGLLPRRVHFFAATGRVKLLVLKRESDRLVFAMEHNGTTGFEG